MHSDFITRNHVVYTNSKTITDIHRDALKEPTDTKAREVYTSRLQLLRHEVVKRKGAASLEHVSYSDLPRPSFHATIKLTKPLPALGLKQGHKISLYNQYCYHNRLNGKAYMGEDGKIHEVHHAVAASWDRSTEDAMMARILRDGNGQIICYAGRPDTKRCVDQQAREIFCQEKEHLPQNNGVYELTYVVNSLTDASCLQHPLLADERESLEQERECLQERLVEIDGHKVHLKPIHVHHILSYYATLSPILPDHLSGLDLENEINAVGYEQLYALAKTPLAKDIVFHLQKGDLPPHERLMLVDLLARLCKLPIAHHCKSVVHRTSLALSIATINHLIANGDIPIPVEKGKLAPHLLCREEDYKHLFLAILNTGHQVCRDAQIGLLPTGHIIGSKQLGLSQHNDPLGIIPAIPCTPLFPKETLTKTRLRTVAMIAGAFLLGVALITLLYHITILGATVWTSCKTGKWQGEFLKQMSFLPFYCAWRCRNFAKIDFITTINCNHPEFNKDERSLFFGANITPLKTGVLDPRYHLMPKHLLKN